MSQPVRRREVHLRPSTRTRTAEPERGRPRVLGCISRCANPPPVLRVAVHDHSRVVASGVTPCRPVAAHHLHPTRRGGRAVMRRLAKPWPAARLREFDSLPLRHLRRVPLCRTATGLENQGNGNVRGSTPPPSAIFRPRSSTGQSGVLLPRLVRVRVRPRLLPPSGPQVPLPISES